MHRSLRALLVVLPAVGCGESAWQPSPVGPLEERAEALPDFSLDRHGDMVPLSAGDPAIGEPPPGTLFSSDDDAPRVFFEWYADGGPPPSKSICAGTPPKFTCSFGGGEGVMGCKKKVQAYLDRWYADFNIIFVDEKPSSGKYYTEVIVNSSSLAWCDSSFPSGVLGVAPAGCSDQNGNTCYTFSCTGAQICAQTLAQEQAHLVGLMHTTSKKDLMYPSAPCSTCDQFDNAENPVDGGSCRSTQNSYTMMRDRLGMWPGGTKPPGPGSAPCDDKDAPAAAIDEPADGATVPEDFVVRASGMDDCTVKEAKIELGGSSAVSAGPGPYMWSLTKISGTQTITVTVSDTSGKSTSTSITIHAPGGGGGGSGGGGQGGGAGQGGAAGGGDPESAPRPGCEVGGRGNASSFLALVLGALVLRLSRRRRSR